ncbi:MAG: hypothetical protein V4751_12500 [Pseudomonadota bacterium]
MKVAANPQGLGAQILLQDARRAHVDGRYTQAVSMVCEALEAMLASRESTVIRALLRVYPWPSASTRLLHTEIGHRIELCQENYSATQSCQHLEYAEKLPSVWPQRTVAEAVYVFLQEASTRCLQSGLRLSYKRWLLSCLRRMRSVLLPRLAQAAAHREALVLGLGALLHEPRSALFQLLNQHDDFLASHYAKRLQHHPQIVTHEPRRKFIWQEQDAYRALISRCPGSRVLVTIHMGDFVGAFRCLAEQVETGRQVLSLQRERHNAVTHALNADLRLQILPHGEGVSAAVVAGLRKGNQSLGVLFDLREDFGATTEVLFFGQRARLVKGPAMLAILGRAPIIPFVTWECDGVDQIDMEDMIDTRVRDGESLPHAVTRITQMLARLAEKWIRRTPAQWKYLPALLSYCSVAASAERAPR